MSKQRWGINPGTRWENGMDHHEASEIIFDLIYKADLDDYMDWKRGGDGDNGETLMYTLDDWFHRDPEALRKLIKALELVSGPKSEEG